MLTKKTRKLISKIIDKSFAKLKGEFLGPEALSSAFYFALKNYEPKKSLLGAYIHANSEHAAHKDAIDKQTMDRLLDTADNYIETLKNKSIADIMRIVDENLSSLKLKSNIKDATPQQVIASKEGKEILGAIKEQLVGIRDKIDRGVDTIVNVEIHNAQNHGASDAILKMAKSIGISDPTVFKIGVLDDNRCKHCWALWTLKDKVTPRVYKMSELAGNSDPKNPVASVSTTHPNCRDVLTFLSPGFGFDSNGKVIYIGKDASGNPHDEYKKQRN